jgi:prepilin-type N-terminal cleavage/methylation domain-containing protein
MPQHLTLISASTFRRFTASLRRRFGLTLLEVLIVLVLLAAVAAVVAPVVIDRLDERAFEAAADNTSEQLMMARAHAQATGEPVEVTFSPATGNVQARVYAPWEADHDLDAIEPGTSPLASTAMEDQTETADAGSSHSTGFPGAMDSQGESVGGGTSIAEAWATRTLGHGMRINTRPPFFAGEGELNDGEEICLPDGTVIFAAADDEEFETLADLASGGQDVRLAVFMPDGSAMVGDELWLDDGRGRCGRFSINAWSGLPIFQRLANLQAPDATHSQAANSEATETEPDGETGRSADRPSQDD